ncbi:UPF0481 protein At3g47200-like [Castanea sativa]|uniref:UPF0481 protein At3g47200-like n=1 Tax=Castanea sativa TaxID=21020 RepID=UPI003F64CFC8
MEASSSSGGTGDENDKLLNKIGKMLNLPDMESSESCIHRVPWHIRKWKEQAYTPQVVSIGPFHHKSERLKVMEEQKERYLRSFMKRSRTKVEDLVNKIRKMEKCIRGCYEEIIDLSSDEFVEMILMDASFILELFIRETPRIKARDDHDPMFVKPRDTAVMFDLLLLENQLPFFVIEQLHQLTFRYPCKSDPGLFNCGDLVQLSLNYFADSFDFNFEHDRSNVRIEHFTDLLRTYQIPPRVKRPKRVYHARSDLLYTASQLHEAGVKFKVVEKSDCRFDIIFEKGVLKIPEFELDDWTEVATRNIMALEQTHYIYDTYFTDYLFLMDSLINTKEDVDLLCENKILVNYLGDNNAAYSMINDLNKGITWIMNRQDYIDLYANLNGFCEKRWNRWKATLKREYFSTPWRTASTVAAIILLVLTFIQTVYSIR